MSGFDEFLGSEQLISRLRRDIASGSMPHALILEGKKGTGKRMLAKLIAAAISCGGEDKPCMTCTSCSKIMRDQSPDVIFAVPEKDRVQLGVDVIRKIREDAVFAAVDLPVKFFIFPDADAMNMQAQNALLKILEEPPERIMFLLLSQSAQNLLPTIRSRAPVMRVMTLSDDVLTKALLRDENAATLKKTDEEAFYAAVRLAGGSLGRAKELADPERAGECLEQYKKAMRFMELLADRTGASGEFAFFEFASRLVSAKQREELAQIYGMLADAARDFAACRLGSSPELVFFASREKAQSLADRFDTAQLIRLADIFMEAGSALYRNVNVNLLQMQVASACCTASRAR